MCACQDGYYRNNNNKCESCSKYVHTLLPLVVMGKSVVQMKLTAECLALFTSSISVTLTNKREVGAYIYISVSTTFGRD